MPARSRAENSSSSKPQRASCWKRARRRGSDHEVPTRRPAARAASSSTQSPPCHAVQSVVLVRRVAVSLVFVVSSSSLALRPSQSVRVLRPRCCPSSEPAILAHSSLLAWPLLILRAPPCASSRPRARVDGAGVGQVDAGGGQPAARTAASAVPKTWLARPGRLARAPSCRASRRTRASSDPPSAPGARLGQSQGPQAPAPAQAFQGRQGADVDRRVEAGSTARSSQQCSRSMRTGATATTPPGGRRTPSPSPPGRD